MIWIAVHGSGLVLRVNPPTGTVIDEIHVGVPQPTSVAIGGGKIYVTTANSGMNADELKRYPASGGLFITETALTGIQSPKFKG